MDLNTKGVELLLILLWISSSTGASKLLPENSVQAFSEGSDCRCKCILSTQDGGPCDKIQIDGPRKTIYTVETISGGRDCRCSCNTPQPAGCDAIPDVPTVGGGKKTSKRPRKDKDDSRIDLVQLHSSISNMVAAMVKLEKAVQKRSSTDEQIILRENVQKVVTDLENTDGAYQDLLTDLDLDSRKFEANVTSKENETEIESKASTPPLVAPPRNIKDQKHFSKAKVDVLPIPTSEIVDRPTTKPSGILQRFLKDIRLITTKRSSGGATTPPVPIHEESTDTKQVDDEFDLIMSSRSQDESTHITAATTRRTTENVPSTARTRAKTSGPTTENVPSTARTRAKTSGPTTENIPSTARTRAKTSARAIEFSIAASTGSKVTTVDLQQNEVVKPKLVFVPYRATTKKDSDSKKVAPKNEKESEEYDYNYDEQFDVGDEDSEKGTAEPLPDDADDVTSTAKPNTTARVTTMEVTTTSRPASNATTKGTKDEEYSYADYLEQYDNEDETYDYEDYENFDSTLRTTTTTTKTTTTAEMTTTTSDNCGTLHIISPPRLVSHFGRKEGAWMKDPIPSKTDPDRHKRIYMANFYYGNKLIEFDNLEGLRNLRWRNVYHLPHNWIGTGHIVYNGSFYYNRAFSRSLIKYNLQYRFVSAWSHLTNAIYDQATPFTWRGHSMVHMAADEDGLWVIFPSQDPFDSDAKLTYVINKINPVDLRTIKSFKSKIRQSVSHVFMVCGVVYSTDRYNARHARVTHAFDTRTSVQRSFYLGFENMFSYTVQLLYNPKERKLYAWDNGRQVEYKVNMIY